MGKTKIDYEQPYDGFKEIEHISSELIWGDKDYISNPWFTYVIPAYKRGYLLKETLESVLNQLPVDFQWDVIVVDNEAGDANETEEVIKEINNQRVLYYRNCENLGVDGNYNRCIWLARGKWVAMLHADDLIVDDHLRLMAGYIKEHENDRKPLAYISPEYVEFSNKNNINLSRREVAAGEDCLLKTYLTKEAYRGKLSRYRQIDGVITGYSVSLPSFGTVMNRDIMIKTGGFNKNLGICEDVITPYKLAAKYQVYKTPKVMGFYRFENNESMKIETIKKIYESMTDFREYMFSRFFLGGIWRRLGGKELNRELAEYCVSLSRFSDKRLTKAEIDSVYENYKMSYLKLRIYWRIRYLHGKYRGYFNFDDTCNQYIEGIIKEIEEANKKYGRFIVYGAGRAGKNVVRYLKKKYKGVEIYVVISENVKENDSLCGVPICNIKDMIKYKKESLVIVSTIIQEYHEEMMNKAKGDGFEDVISLIKTI